MKECRHPCCSEKCRKKKEKKRRKPIRQFSVKRERINRLYSQARAEFLKDGDPCEARLEGCTGVATDLHHPQGRLGERLTDVKKCKKVCRNCHNRIENEPAMAKEKGLSESRLTNTNNR